jgi:ABC-type Zn uptake system ZnuABC Zn-binding protein ZnuA
VLSCARPTGPAHRLQIVTTIGVLADWARNVAGDRAEVFALLSGMESPHTYETRPSVLRRIARADVLFRVGLGLEEWLEPVIQNAGNRNLAVIDAATGIPIIGRDEPAGGTEHEREHEAGNPHVWLDPELAKLSIDNLVQELCRIDPPGESLYRRRQDRYARRLDSLSGAIHAAFADIPVRRIITFHDAWPYFARRFGIDVVASIEPIPGKEASARSIARLIDTIRQENIRVICTEPQLPSDVPTMLGRSTGARVLMLNPLCTDENGRADYLRFLGDNACRIAVALSASPPSR